MSRYEKERQNLQILAGQYHIELYVVQRWELIPDVRVHIQAEMEELVGIYSSLELANNAIWINYFNLARKYKEEWEEEETDTYFQHLVMDRSGTWDEMPYMRWSCTTHLIDQVSTEGK